MKSAFLTSGWGLPLTVGVALHVGVAFIPVAFSQGSSTLQQPQPVRIALVSAPEPPPAVMPPEPVEIPKAEPIVEQPPEVAAKPRPRKKKQKAVVSPSEPLASNSAIAAAEVDTEEIAAEVDAQPAELPVEEAAIAPEVANHAPPPAPVKKFDMQGYGMGVFSAVNAEQQYPRAAARFHLEGTAKIRIRVNRDGSLADRPRIVTSTTHDLLDREAIRMVEVAAPFAPLPDGFPEQTTEFVIPIKFQLSRS